MGSFLHTSEIVVNGKTSLGKKTKAERLGWQSMSEIKKEFKNFTQQDATFIFVTNEIGMGGTSENEVQRKFTDLQGWINQYIANQADEVILMVSGIPVKIKG